MRQAQSQLPFFFSSNKSPRKRGNLSSSLQKWKCTCDRHNPSYHFFSLLTNHHEKKGGKGSTLAHERKTRKGDIATVPILSDVFLFCNTVKCNAKSGELELAGTLTQPTFEQITADIPDGAPRLVLMRHSITIGIMHVQTHRPACTCTSKHTQSTCIHSHARWRHTLRADHRRHSWRRPSPCAHAPRYHYM